MTLFKKFTTQFQKYEISIFNFNFFFKFINLIMCIQITITNLYQVQIPNHDQINIKMEKQLIALPKPKT